MGQRNYVNAGDGGKDFSYLAVRTGGMYKGLCSFEVFITYHSDRSVCLNFGQIVDLHQQLGKWIERERPEHEPPMVEGEDL